MAGAIRELPQEYRQDLKIRELTGSVARIEKRLDKLDRQMEALVESIASLRCDIKDLHIESIKHTDALHAESIKHTDALHAETLKQYNTIVWKTVGLLGTVAAIAKYVLS